MTDLQAEEPMALNDRMFREWFEKSGMPICCLDKSGRISARNKSFKDQFSYSGISPVNLGQLWDLANPDPSMYSVERSRWAAAIYREEAKDMALEGGEFALRCGDGEIRYMEISLTKVTDCVLMSLSDLSRHKSVEEDLRRRLVVLTHGKDEPEGIEFPDLFDLGAVQELQERFCRATGVASVITKPNGEPITAPSNFCRLCKDIVRATEAGRANCYASDATLGQSRCDGPIVMPCLSCGLWDAGASIQVNGRHIANWLIGQVRDGSQNAVKTEEYAREIGADPVEALKAFEEVPIMAEEKFRAVADFLFSLANQLSDIAYQNIQQSRYIESERKSQAALMESERRLSLALEATHAAIWQWDAEGDALFLSERWYDMLGYTPGKFKMTLHAWFEIGHAEDLGLLKGLAAECIASKGRQGMQCEVRLRAKDGSWRWIRIMGDVTRRNELGQGVAMSGLALDIDELKGLESERRRLEDELRQAQRIESLGQLAGGIAHDFNNMLAIILGNAEIAKDFTDTKGPGADSITQIIEAARKSGELVRQLLAFARKQPISPQIIELNQSLEKTMSMLRRLIGESIELNWQPSPDPCMVKIDPVQLSQILTNLVVNARDAIDGHGKIRIQTELAGISNLGQGSLPSEAVRLIVSDDGRGMGEDVLSKIFEPFFTTKEQGKGTGLGLATVYGVVKQNGGSIKVESKEGKGTSFTILLPRSRETADIPPASPQKPTRPSTGGTILVVEDEEMIRRLVEKSLLREGYLVICATSPGEAIMQCRDNGPIDLIISDVIMPEMNGRQMLDQIRQLRPRQKAIFMSGYTADVAIGLDQIDELTGFLAKPFGPQDLAHEVQRLLSLG